VTVKGQRHIETQADTPPQGEAEARRCLGERFEVERMVGSGGMGVVFRCRDLLDGSTVAVKLLQRREYLAIERFAREATTLASLNHPAIVRYIAHGITPQGEPYLAMEWLEGETLADCIARGPIDPKAVARLGARVLQALAAAHAHGIVHRDLKPTNIFLTDGDLDQAKLLDFGIAQRGQNAGAWRITRPGGAMGTPVYMAPEQYRDGSNVDSRADVFSLACVLVESLVGEPPRLFVGSDDGAFAWEEGTLQRLQQAAPEPLQRILGRMLALAVEDRPADVESLSRELREAADEISDGAPPSIQPGKKSTLSDAEQRVAAVIAVLGIPADGAPAGRFVELTASLTSHGAPRWSAPPTASGPSCWPRRPSQATWSPRPPAGRCRQGPTSPALAWPSAPPAPTGQTPSPWRRPCRKSPGWLPPPPPAPSPWMPPPPICWKVVSSSRSCPRVIATCCSNAICVRCRAR
jgi:serine/threonine protein kinase